MHRDAKQLLSLKFKPPKSNLATSMENIMKMDASKFPYVWVDFTHSHAEPEHDHTEDFERFEALLARKEKFVFLSLTAEQDDHEHTQEEKKQVSLWMKKHKHDLRTYVKGMVHIEPGAAKRLAMKAFAGAFSKFWGYPLLVAGSEEEALGFAERLLSDAPDK